MLISRIHIVNTIFVECLWTKFPFCFCISVFLFYLPTHPPYSISVYVSPIIKFFLLQAFQHNEMMIMAKISWKCYKIYGNRNRLTSFSLIFCIYLWTIMLFRIETSNSTPHPIFVSSFSPFHYFAKAKGYGLFTHFKVLLFI